MVKSSITGLDPLVERIAAIDKRLLSRLLHAGALEQMRSAKSRIPRATGALQKSLLDGSDDLVTDYRVTLSGVEYAKYHDLPKIDARRLVEEAGAALFRRAGLTGGF